MIPQSHSILNIQSMEKRSEQFKNLPVLKKTCRKAVLVAIAIPVFTTQLERSREATDISNVRAAYAEAAADYLATGAKEEKTATAPVQQKEADWQMGAEQAVIHSRVNGVDTTVSIPAKTTGTYTVKVAADGSVSVS